MRNFWTRAKVVAVAMLVLCALSAAPAGAYCNSDPCQYNNHIVCSICTFVDEVNGTWCRYTLFYCVDCQTGEWLQWDVQEDYCIYEPL